MMDDKKYAPALKSYMDAYEVTNSKLADILGVSRPQAWRIVKCESGLTRTNAKKFCVAVGLPQYKSEDLYETPVTAEDLKTYSTSSATDMGNPKQSMLDGSYGRVRIPEYDVLVAAGNSEPVGEELIKTEWDLPEQDVRFISTHPQKLAIIKVVGDSMEPEYQAGEKVLIDTAINQFIGDGVYVFDAGCGLMIKHFQLILNSLPKAVKIISSNKIYEPQRSTLEKLSIKGKVAVKWSPR